MSTFVRNLGLRKRKTVKSRGYKIGAEVKQKNAFTNEDDYNAWAIVPFNYDTTIRATRPFELTEIVMPSQGTARYQRIGNRINMRWLRMKGYLAVYDRLISNCRLKVYLVRTYGRSINQTGFQALWKNWENIGYDASIDMWALLNHMRHNYYKACLDIDKVGKEKGVVISKIGEMKIHASSHSMDAYHNGAHVIPVAEGEATVPEQVIVHPYEFESVDNVPFDIKISLHETIDCTTDHYYLYFMQDYPYCTNNDMKAYTSYPQPSKVSGYELNFFTRYYYTDA